MQTADQDLLALWLRERDAEAFREVALRYAAMVFGVCRRILGNASDAEDAAQETFVRLAEIQKPNVNLGPWLHRVAVNCSLAHLRSERRRVRREQAYAAATGENDDGVPADVLAGLDEAVAALPARLREPLVLHFYNGETHEAIAQRLGVSRQTVGYRVQKGVGRVRAEMKKKGMLVTSAALAAVLEQDAAAAVPASIATYIGKLAVVGDASAGSAVAGLGGGLSKAAGAKIAAAIVLGGIAAVVALNGLLREAPAEDKPATDTIHAQVKEAATESAVAARPQQTAGKTAAPAAADLQVIPDDERGDFTLLVSVFYGDGAPAAGARVQVGRMDPGPPMSLRVRKGTTDGDGNLLFKNIAGAGTVTASGMKDGNRLFGFCFDRVHGGCAYRKVQVVLYPVVDTEVTVVDERGAPVAGAAVYPMEMALTPGFIKRLTHRAVPENVETWMPHDLALAMALETDAQGRFTAEIWPDTLLNFFVIAPGYAPRRTGFMAAGDTTEVAVARGTTVNGTISVGESGASLSGAKVRVENREEDFDKRYAETDGAGRFVFSGLGPGEYKIAVKHDEYALHPDERQFVVGNEETMELVYAAVKCGTASGRVVDAATGEGMAGITVEHGGGYETVKTETDSDGRFMFAGLCGPGYVRVPLDTTYYTNSREFQEVSVVSGEELSGIVLKCKKRDIGLLTIVRGRTVDEEGNGVPGVYVQARDMFKQYAAAARSDSAGAFCFEGVPLTGDLQISAEKPGLASTGAKKLAVGSGGLEDVEVVLRPTGSISGTLVDVNGKPYSAVDWQINAQTSAGFGVAPVMPGGTFKLVDLPPDEYRLHIDMESPMENFFDHSLVVRSGIPETLATVNLEPGQHVKDVTVACRYSVNEPRLETEAAEPEPMGPLWSIECAVLGPDGRPVPELQRRCIQGGGEYSGEGEEARWRWEGKTPSVSVTFAAKGCLSQEREFLRSDAAGGKLTREIRMQAGCVVEGRVVDANGEPAPGASVHIGQVRKDLNPFVTDLVYADEEGNYRVDTLPPEPVELFAEHPSFTLGSIVVTPVSGRVTRADIVLTQGGGIEGHVYSAGQPVKGVGVQYGSGNNSEIHASTDENGFYRITHVPPGPLDVKFLMTAGKRYVLINRELDIQQGRMLPVDVHFAGLTAGAEGAVTVNGAPAPSANVRYRSLTGDGEQIFSMETSLDGYYETGPVPAGEAELLIGAILDRQVLTCRLEVTLNAGETLRQDVAFTGTAGISGTAPGASLVILYEGATLPAAGWAGSVASTQVYDGMYQLNHIPAGTYTLHAAAYPVSPENEVTKVVSLYDGEQKTVNLEAGGPAE